MLFSVLIPIYNAEKLLSIAIESVLKQTDQDFELILLDDGSSDNSVNVGQNYAQLYPEKIKIKTQENQGEFFTRRNLAKLASGDYLVYLDPDDYLNDNALEQLRECISNTEADLILFDLLKIIRDKKEQFSLPYENYTIFDTTNKKMLYRQLLMTKNLNSMCTKAISRGLIDLEKDYRAVMKKPLRIGEDLLQSCQVVDAAKKICYLKEALYNYHKNDEGATARVLFSDYYGFLILEDYMDRFIQKWHMEIDVIEFVYRKRIESICSYINAAHKEFKKEKKISDFFSFVHLLQKDEKFITAVKQSRMKKMPLFYRICVSLVRMDFIMILHIFLNFIEKKTEK